MPASANMLNKSMNNPSGPIDQKTQETVIKKVKKSSEMKNEINKCLSNNKDKNTFTCSGAVNQDTGFVSDKDLHGSIGQSNYKIVGQQNADDLTVNLKITLSDTYNFDKWRTPFYKPFNAANNFGYIYQNIGYLTPYPWEISFDLDVFLP